MLKEFTVKKDFFKFINNYDGELRIVNCTCFDVKTNEPVAVITFNKKKSAHDKFWENKMECFLKKWLG